MHQGIGGLIAMARGNYGFVIGHLDIRPLSALTLATVGPSKLQDATTGTISQQCGQVGLSLPPCVLMLCAWAQDFLTRCARGTSSIATAFANDLI